MRFLALLMTSVMAFLACENEPPSVPIVLGPQRVRLGDTVQFELLSVDREGDTVSFFLNWSGGAQSGWTGWWSHGVYLPVPVSFAESGSFNLTVKARDGHSESGWSDTSFVRVGSFPPSVPRRPVGPDTVVVYDTVTYTTSAAHPLYQLVAVQFAWNDSLEAWSRFVMPDSPVRVRHQFTRGGWVAVRCRAKDKAGYVSDWSMPETVLVVDSFRLAAGSGR